MTQLKGDADESAQRMGLGDHAATGFAMPVRVAGSELHMSARGTRPIRKPAFLGPIDAKGLRWDRRRLLTGGGWDGCVSAASLPLAADPERRRTTPTWAIHTNYRAVLDITTAGGYGRLYGPNVSLDGVGGLDARSRADRRHRVSRPRGRRPSPERHLMVQVPDAFDPTKACIVTATASGSRGAYGAIGASGGGLKRGCAVAYTDKGTGNGCTTR